MEGALVVDKTSIMDYLRDHPENGFQAVSIKVRREYLASSG